MAGPWTSPDGRTIAQILFSRKREVENFPWIHGGQPLEYPARRNKGTSALSAMLAKAVVVALKGDVVAIARVAGGVWLESRSQTGHGIHPVCWIDGCVWLPRGNVTYLLGILAIADAVLYPAASADLLDAWDDLLTCFVDNGRRLDETLAGLIGRASDELYYWLRYREQDPGPDHDRLNRLDVADSATLTFVSSSDPLDVAILTDLDRLRAHRRVAPPPVSVSEPRFPDARFRGWQLPELIETLDLGMHAMLVGPTATGKSLCAAEAFARAKVLKPVFVIEGHESLKEFDLLGGFTPDGEGGFIWRDGIVVRAMRAGGYLFVDEANRMPTRTLNVLLGVLSRGAVVLTENGSEEVTAVPGFQVVLAMNLGRDYVVNGLDAALISRFPVTLEFTYLPPAEEGAWLVGETALDREVAHVMVKVAGETRRLRRNHELARELTPRGLLAWATKYRAKPGGDLASRLQATAKVTWIPGVVGADADGYVREEGLAQLLELIAAHCPAGR
jgi:hypothetical protein